MKKYTVLLAYPDYMTDDRAETYSAHVEAKDPEAALAEARRQVIAANDGSLDPESEDFIEPTDFASVAVYEGFLDDLNPEARW